MGEYPKIPIRGALNDGGTVISNRRERLIPQDDGTIILVDYYRGAYGHTLRVDIQCSDSLARLRRLLTEFADAKVQQASLGEVGGVVLSEVKAILLKLWPRREEPRRLVKIIQRNPRGHVFQWTRSSEGWREWAGLVDGLQSPGHQYLAGRNLDDALVEVAFMERPVAPRYQGRLQ